MKKIITLLIDINELIMLKHTIFALPFIAISMLISFYLYGQQNIQIMTFVLGAIAAFNARSFAMGINRFLDMDIDIKNQRTKNRPSVDGRISPKIQLIFIIVYAFIFILSAFFINKTAFYLSVPVLFVLAFYSYTKRFTYLAHLFLGLSLGLAPLAGDIAISQSIHIWSIFLFLGVVFWVAGFDILYSIQDIEFDDNENLHSIPSRFGIKVSLWIVHIFHTLTSIFWIYFAYYLSLGIISWFGLSFSIIMLIYENKIVRQDINNINKAFFAINGYISIVFFITILLDMIFRTT